MTDKNLYAYCDNNPVVRTDSAGEFWNIAAGAIMGAVISAGMETLFQVAEYIKTGNGFDVSNIIVAGVAGAASGFVAATSLNIGWQMVSNAVISGFAEGYSQLRSGNRDPVSLAKNIGSTAVVGALCGAIGGDGIRVKGSEYRVSIRNYKIAKNKVKVSNSKRAIKQFNRATKKVRAVGRTATKETTIRYTAGSFVATTWGKVKRFFGW